MRISSIIRLASAGLLLCSMSSFSGCDKDKECPSPTRTKKCQTPTTAPADTTKTQGAS